jgi:hypothetical protein
MEIAIKYLWRTTSGAAELELELIQTHMTQKPMLRATAGRTIKYLRRTTNGAADYGLYTTTKYLRGAAGIGMGTMIKYLRGAAVIGMGTTINYLRGAAASGDVPSMSLSRWPKLCGGADACFNRCYAACRRLAGDK